MIRPPLVERALAVDVAAGFEGSLPDEDGAMLHVLAAGRNVGRAAAIGQGTGVASAWIASALPPGVPLHTVERDPGLAAVVERLLDADDDVHVHVGDWESALTPHAPFDLVFVAADDAVTEIDPILGIAAPRATLVVDLSHARRLAPAARSDAWLAHPRLVATTVGTGHPSQLVIAAVRG